MTINDNSSGVETPTYYVLIQCA